MQLFPIEVKSRVGPGPIDEAKNRLRRHIGAGIWEDGQVYFLKLDATDPQLHSLIGCKKNKNRARNEVFQLLHHAFVYGVDGVVLLVGTNRALMFAVQVEFPLSLLASYKRLIDECWNRWFKGFYVPDIKDFPTERVMKALEVRNKKRKRIKVDRHSFFTNYKLWRCLNVSVSAGIKFPLPPMSMIVPFVNSFWNSTKGPSDTMTKLMDSCEENLGIRAPQAVAVARFLNIQAVAFHRINQVMTARDMSIYSSLKSFRNAANSRFSLKRSMGIIIQLLKEEVDKETPPSTVMNQEQQLACPSTPKRGVKTRSAVSVAPVVWHRHTKTGCTPGKGRPKKSNNESGVSNQSRSATCIGLVPLLSEKRMRCRLCGSHTHFFCSWCKRPLCMTMPINIEKKIDRFMDKFDIPEEKRPSHYLQLKEEDKQGKIYKQVAVNTCYHIGHKAQWDRFFMMVNDTSDNENDSAENLANYFQQYQTMVENSNKENSSNSN